MSVIKDHLFKNHQAKLIANNLYVYAIHLYYVLLNILPGFMRVLLLRPLLRRCGRRVYIDHNVYIKFPWLVEIGNTVSINRGVEIYNDFFSKSLVKIGSGVRIAPHVSIHAAGHELASGEFLNTGGDIVIEDDVWIGAGATILEGIVIGKGSVVAAGSVVSKSVPPDTIVGGVPATIIKTIDR